MNHFARKIQICVLLRDSYKHLENFLAFPKEETIKRQFHGEVTFKLLLEQFFSDVIFIFFVTKICRP
jgi:hypothetical protein